MKQINQVIICYTKSNCANTYGTRSIISNTSQLKFESKHNLCEDFDVNPLVVDVTNVVTITKGGDFQLLYRFLELYSGKYNPI